MTDDRTWPGAGTGPLSTATPPTTPGEAPLRRSRKHKVIGGVCGGFGRHYRMDPVIFRVSLVVLSVLGGLGLVAYGVAWLVTPFDGEEENEGRRLLSGRVEGPGLTALLFVVAGCGLMLASLGSSRTTTWFSLEVLAALAAAAYWAKYRRGAEQETTPEGTPAHPKLAQAAAEAPPEARRPPAPSGPSWWRGNAGQASYLWGPEQAAPGDYARSGAPPVGPPAPGGGCRPGGPPVPSPRHQPRELRLGGLVFLGAVVAFGVGVSASWTSQPLGPALVIGFSSALAVFALGLVISAFWGRLGVGTIVSVLLTGGMLAGASVLPENITTSWESHEWRPGDAETVRAQYELGSGQAELDLTGVELGAGGELATEVRAGAGEVTVLVPYDADLEVSVDIAAGAFTYQPLRSLGDEYRDSWGGFAQERLLEYPAVFDAEEEAEREASGETAENARIELRLEMGVGHVQVQRAGEEPRP